MSDSERGIGEPGGAPTEFLRDDLTTSPGDAGRVREDAAMAPRDAGRGYGDTPQQSTRG